VVFRQIRQDFAVKLYTGLFEEGNKAGVADAVLPGGGVYLYLPQAAEVSLFLFAVREHVDSRVQNRLLGLAVFGGARPHVTLRLFQQTLSLSIRLYSSFDSGHGEVIGK